MKKILLMLAGLIAAAAATAQITGSWAGKLEASPEASLALVINIRPDGSATLDSPDQGAYGIPMTVDINEGDSLSVSVSMIKMNFAGRLADGRLSGTFRQGALELPLALEPKQQATRPERPQTPRPPFPYTTEEMTARNTADGATLVGTLTLPATAAPGAPVVLMVSGSGIQDRDETYMDHKPFAVIADALARRGIASLRYDDRGAGQSSGPMNEVTTASNTRDARAMLDLLLADSRFGSVGVLGHSEGARIAYAMPAAFIVGLGAPALRGDSILADQNQVMLMAAGVPMQIAEDYAQAMLKVFAGVDPEKATAKWKKDAVTEPLIENLTRVAYAHDPWLHYFTKDDPAADIRAQKAPMLILYGDRDCQVTPELNAPRMRQLAPEADLRILTGLNHMLQHCTNGTVAEYGRIDETIAPEVLEAIADFILARNR